MTKRVALCLVLAFGLSACARQAPIDPRHVDVCELAARGAELNGQHVSLRAIGNFTHEHGIFLTDNACRDELISVDTTPSAARSPYLTQGDQNLVPFRDAVLDLSGVFHWDAARNPETGAQNSPRTLVVGEIRSLSFVTSQLGSGCEGVGRSRRFCDCLGSNLGAEAKPEYQHALTAIMVSIPPDLAMDLFTSAARSSEFRSIVANAPYENSATRAAFTRCAASARY